MQLFVNSVDLEHEVDWLPDWLAERGAAESLERARALREALRSLLVANGGGALDQGAVEVVDRAAARLSIRLDSDGRPRVGSDGDALDRVVAVSLEAMLDGSWQRLKACRSCRWAFYDYSRNRSATWCSMQLCGNRTKTRAYRQRHTV
ncbi:MAG: CGNR zinc finger domain-containing protein [Gaiellaceae bacterium]